MIIEVTVPKFAEGATSIRLSEWLCQPGEKVEAGVNIAEATTDKIAIQVEAPESGYIQKLLVEAGDVVQVGQVIALISTEPVKED
ncbi:MAG TPA: lipoyl domain-containing protein [Patescibacteria group bacterium]|nr:lipoyl domain-containing protein [Patescibacteria group bacterium]